MDTFTCMHCHMIAAESVIYVCVAHLDKATTEELLRKTLACAQCFLHHHWKCCASKKPLTFADFVKHASSKRAIENFEQCQNAFNNVIDEFNDLKKGLNGISANPSQAPIDYDVLCRGFRDVKMTFDEACVRMLTHKKRIQMMLQESAPMNEQKLASEVFRKQDVNHNTVESTPAIPSRFSPRAAVAAMKIRQADPETLKITLDAEEEIEEIESTSKQAPSGAGKFSNYFRKLP
ncbi:unnamed protein product, partial [Mesorhabditis belari]|uniref:Uncharacterized protein n=1 Tax=Mesorhabditis belari TaxID=2138241 RepID=A0AAF3F5B9_9BILA